MATRENLIKKLEEIGRVKTNNNHFYCFDKSQFNNQIKSGANGFILRAFDVEYNEAVAIKFYFPRDSSEYEIEKDNRNRFFNEISILENAKHPNLIRCLGKGEAFNIPFYVMPYAKGSMKDLLDEKNNFNFKDIEFSYRFFQKLGSVLKYLHDQEVNGEKCYHRDLKPQNILFMEKDEPLLCDLGLAHINPKFAKFDVASAKWLRNPYYCAPEQVFGNANEVNHLVDIYAFGYMLREALTGEHPRGENAPLPSEKKSEYIAIDAVIIKCTEYDPCNRYQSMDECLHDLNIAFNGTINEKEQLAAFYIATKKLKFLSKHWTLTSDLLSADNLKALYLNRSKFQPTNEEEKIVLFHNLLLRGKQEHHEGRSNKKSPTGLSGAAPAALGWYWFRNITTEESLEIIRRAAFHRNNFVRSGAARALGRFGSHDDKIILREMIKDYDANVVSDALRAIAHLDPDKQDIELIRKYKDDNRFRVIEAVAEILGKYGTCEDKYFILEFIKNDNVAVKIAAMIAIGFIAKRENLIFEIEPVLVEFLKHPNEQVCVTARKTISRLNSDLVDDRNAYERSVELIINKYGLNVNNQEARTKAHSFLEIKNVSYQDAGIRWIIKNEKEEINKMIMNHGFQLPDRILQQFDYYINCPQWWRDRMAM